MNSENKSTGERTNKITKRVQLILIGIYYKRAISNNLLRTINSNFVGINHIFKD